MEITTLSERAQEELVHLSVDKEAHLPLAEGIYEGLDAVKYHALDPRIYCSNSMLSKLAQSGKKLLHALTEEFDPTSSAIRKGAALHCRVLEPHDWIEWTVFPESFKLSTIKGKEQWKNACKRSGEAHLRRNHLRHSEHLEVNAMLEAIEQNTDAMQLVTAGSARMNEVTIIFRWLDMLFKGRLDRLFENEYGRVGLDIKTIRDASPDFVSKEIINRGYHRQFALYAMGCQILGKPLDGFAIIAVENAAPYHCEVYEIDKTFLRLGLDELKVLAPQYKYCIENEYFPGYTTGVQVIKPPAWAFHRDPNEMYRSSQMPNLLTA